MSGVKRIEELRTVDRLVTAPASSIDLIDFMSRRAARLLARFYMVDDAMHAASESEKAEAEHAITEVYAIQEAIADMMATGPAGAVHQLVAALGLASGLRESELDAEGRDRRIEAIRRLLLSALRVLLPTVGLEPSDTLVEDHLHLDEAAFLKGYADAA